MKSNILKDYKFLLVSETKGKKSRGAKNTQSWTDKIQELIGNHGGEVSQTICEETMIIVEDQAKVVN